MPKSCLAIGTTDRDAGEGAGVHLIRRSGHSRDTHRRKHAVPYGESVKASRRPSSLRSRFAGGLIGGASLDAGEFLSIVLAQAIHARSDGTGPKQCSDLAVVHRNQHRGSLHEVEKRSSPRHRVGSTRRVALWSRGNTRANYSQRTVGRCPSGRVVQ